MEDKEYELLNKMVVKIDEARTYQRISGILALVFIFEFLYTFFWLSDFDSLYWLIWGVCVVGWTHLDRKYKVAMSEYEELKSEYNTRYEDENL